MSDNLTCAGKTPTTVATAAAAALADFKNPYSTSNKAVTNSGQCYKQILMLDIQE